MLSANELFSRFSSRPEENKSVEMEMEENDVVILIKKDMGYACSIPEVTRPEDISPHIVLAMALCDMLENEQAISSLVADYLTKGLLEDSENYNGKDENAEIAPESQE